MNKNIVYSVGNIQSYIEWSVSATIAQETAWLHLSENIAQRSDTVAPFLK